MDYEKKYNEALERFKSFKEKYYTKDTDLGDVIFDKTGKMQKDFNGIFPQLREREDERMRKRAIAILKQQRDYWSYDGPIDKFPPATPRKDLVDAIDVALSYLEKQKEQKNEFHLPPDFGMAYYNPAPIEQKEQKPADRFEEAREKYQVEWSEEDEKMIERLITRLNWITYNTRTDGTSPNITFFDEIDWLKSLRPSWKPSEEQMSMLLAVINEPNNSGAESCQIALRGIYEQLKKL